MPDNIPVIHGQYLADILAQPVALQTTFTSLNIPKSLSTLAARIRGARFKTVVLTGMGSSFHALHPLQNRLIELGLPALMVETSELVHYKNRLFDRKNILIAVSQSGQSAEILRLLAMNRGKSPLIAVTNTEKSPLAQQADSLLLTQAGIEYSVSCKTYVTALMTLHWLAAVIAGQEMDSSRKILGNAARLTDQYLSSWQEHVAEFSACLEKCRHLFFVGRGNSLAATGTAALITKEAAHFAAEGLSSAAFRHGPLEMLSDETFVLIFAGDRKAERLNQNLLVDIRACHGKAEFVAAGAASAACALPPAHQGLRPILEILPAQMITLALAALAGREAGRFDFASKITTKE